MDIRDSLTDAYLASFFDDGSLVRARAYVAAVEDLEVVHETDSSLTATATVHGTAAEPYLVQLHAEVDVEGDWVFSSCSCPVGRMCKHGAAVALRVRGRAPEQHLAEARWRRHLGRLGDDLEARARSSMTGQPLGLEVSRRPAGRWSRSSAGDLSMRPVRPGARRGWARSGAEWTDLAGPVAVSRFVPAQAESLQVLRRGLVARHTYLVAGAAPMLDDYDDRMVPALRAAIAAGVTLVPGAGLASVAVSDEPAEVVADVTETDGTLTLQTWVRVGDRRVRGGDVAPIGRPITSVALFDGDDVVLADLREPCHEAVMDLVLDDPVSVEEADREPFLTALAPLGRLVRVESTDGSVQLPAPPRPRLHLGVTWRSSTHADLDWRWDYGDRSAAVSSSDPLGGLRDAGLEQAVLATVPAGLVAASTVADGDALAFALHDLPHLRTLDDVDVEEHEPPDFREATDAPAITFTLADAPSDHTDWLDLEVQVSVDGERVPLPDVLAALTRGDEFLVLPSGLYVALARPEFARLHEVVALAAELRESEPDRLRVGAADLGVWAELADLGVVDEQAARWVERATALRNARRAARPEPVGLDDAPSLPARGVLVAGVPPPARARRGPGRRHGPGQDAAGRSRCSQHARGHRRAGAVPGGRARPASSPPGASRRRLTRPACASVSSPSRGRTRRRRSPTRRGRRRGGDHLRPAAPRARAVRRARRGAGWCSTRRSRSRTTRARPTRRPARSTPLPAGGHRHARSRTG